MIFKIILGKFLEEGTYLDLCKLGNFWTASRSAFLLQREFLDISNILKYTTLYYLYSNLIKILIF